MQAHLVGRAKSWDLSQCSVDMQDLEHQLTATVIVITDHVRVMNKRSVLFSYLQEYQQLEQMWSLMLEMLDIEEVVAV